MKIFDYVDQNGKVWFGITMPSGTCYTYESRDERDIEYLNKQAS